jgi:RES domain-containing protein
LTLRRSELDLIAAWTDTAKPHRGVYFRSVSYTFMRPETVLDGAGAAAHGDRFASPGTAAVYLSESDAVATSEVTGRKKRLGGAALINVDKYPRVVFAVGFDLTRVLDLTSAKRVGSHPGPMSR